MTPQKMIPQTPLPPAPSVPAIDAMIKHSVVQLARRGTARVAPIDVRAGEHPLRIPTCAFAIDLSVPRGNTFQNVEVSTTAQPRLPAPQSLKRRAWSWLTSPFAAAPPPPPPLPRAADDKDPYLRPFRATLAKPVIGRVANLTGVGFIDRFLHKHLRVECTGLRLEADGNLALNGSIRPGLCKLPLWNFFVPFYKCFRVNMNMRTMLDEPLICQDEGCAEEALSTKRYLFAWLGSVLGDVHAEMKQPGRIELAPGVHYTPEHVTNDLRFTAEGLRMTLATHGALERRGEKVAVATSMPIAVDLEPDTQSPMHVELGPAPISLRGQVGEAVQRPGTFYNQGIGEWSLVNGELTYDDNQQEYFDPEGDFEADAPLDGSRKAA